METKGLTLEEVDRIFEGDKHSSVPDVEAVRTGQADVSAYVNEEKHVSHDDKAMGEVCVSHL